MKMTNYQRMIAVTLLLAGGASMAWAVNPDNVAPCWRDETGATRQVWTFDSNANPIAPSTKVNQPGSPEATLTLGFLGQGWTDTTCARYGNGCGPTVIAFLPLNGTAECGGPPYLAYSNGVLGRLAYDVTGDGSEEEPYECATTGSYINASGEPSVVGSAQGYWDMGGTGSGISNRVVLTIPNSGSPDGTRRFFSIQGTFYIDSVFKVPLTYAVTNGLGVGSSTRVAGSSATNDVEIPLDKNGDQIVISGNPKWVNMRAILRLLPDTAAGSDTVTIRSPSAFLMDAVIVETLDRVAQNDAVSTPRNTVTTIPFATLLANDLGGRLVSVGNPVNGTVATNSGNVVTFTPAADFTGTASFWYTNRDCAGLTNLAAQVAVDVTAPVNQPPVLTNSPTTYVRAPNITLKIRITSLLADNAYDPEGGPVNLAGVSSQSTNSAVLNVWTNSTHIFYTNSANVADSFTYTVADTNGATAVGIVLININANVTSQAAAITVTNATVLVTFAGVPNYPYEAQRATNTSFTGTLRLWLTNAPANGVFQVTDDFSDIGGQPSQAYYRLRYAP